MIISGATSTFWRGEARTLFKQGYLYIVFIDYLVNDFSILLASDGILCPSTARDSFWSHAPLRSADLRTLLKRSKLSRKEMIQHCKNDQQRYSYAETPADQLLLDRQQGFRRCVQLPLEFRVRHEMFLFV
jgi:hypothetical protein